MVVNNLRMKTVVFKKTILCTLVLKISAGTFFEEVKEAGSFYSLVSMYISNKTPSHPRRPYS
jgi:hypothetical protein